jgi:tetratricopeptide (TPR) repeat protein
VPRLAAWVATATGLELNERGTVRVVDNDAWLEQRRRLQRLGGPPPDRAQRLDPILFGDNPMARGDAWRESGQWDLAEAAYAEATRARPFNESAWCALARYHIERGEFDRAAVVLEEAVRTLPDDQDLAIRLGLALLLSGDRAAWRRAVAALIAHTLPGDRAAWRSRLAALIARSDAMNAALLTNGLAWACIVGPKGTDDPDVAVGLAEAAVNATSQPSARANIMNTLGAALYRAGRFEEAIRRFDEEIQLRRGTSLTQDWPYLAMAHHRLGHRDEARRWLDRLRNYQPNTDRDQFWAELEIRLLRSEAEAVILYDAVFPIDPFAH